MPKFYIDNTGKAHAEMPEGFIFEVDENTLELASMPRHWINQSKDLFATIIVNGEDLVDIIRIDAIENLGFTSLEAVNTENSILTIFCQEDHWVDAVKYFAEGAKKNYVGLPVEVALTSLPKYMGSGAIKKRNIQHKRVRRYLRRKGIWVVYNVLFSGMLSDRIKPTADELEWMERVGQENHFDMIA